MNMTGEQGTAIAAYIEQVGRYRDSLDTLCFTDYLDFHFYDRHVFVDSVRIRYNCMIPL